ncbi:hypothetical protein ABK040_008656 [Willaertia magna]
MKSLKIPLKSLQRSLYSFSTTKYGALLLIIISFITLNSLLHLLQSFLNINLINKTTLYEDSNTFNFGKYCYETFHDNINKKSFLQQLCYEPMDIVYTWVNGSDPIHIENLKYYTNKEIENIVKQESIDDDFIGSDKVSTTTTTIYTRKLLRKLLSINSTATDKDITTDKDMDDSTISVNRFRDNSELKYSLRSLEKYAGWIRNIYIVTNGQVPNWLNLNNPKIHIITHKEIFPNPNDLPVFSSPSIESNIHRIKNLSKRFIYLNDDVMFGNFIYPEDFYSHSTGQKVFLSWDVPTCSPNCQDSWLGDGYCDLNCNTTECDYDGGDCIGKDIQLNRYGNSNYGNSNSGWYSNNDYTPSWDVNNGNNYQISGKSVSSYCNSNCPNSWIGDRFCDRSCNVKECGFDSGDCDFENIRNYLPHLNITTTTTINGKSSDNNRMDSIYMLNNITSFYLDLSKVFREITNGNYNNDNLIRTSTISQKEKLLIINLNYQNILMNFTNNKFSNEEVIITLEGKPIINNSNSNNNTTVNNNNGDNNNTKKDEVKIEVKIKLVTNDIFELIKKKVNDEKKSDSDKNDKKKIMMIGVNKEMEKKINNEIFKESNLMNALKNHLENNLNDKVDNNDKQQQDDKVNNESKENDAMNDIYNFLNDNINTNKDTNNKNNNNKKKKENVNKKDNKKENVKKKEKNDDNVKSEINELIKKLQEENDNITKNDKKQKQQQQHVEEQMKVITNNNKKQKKKQQNIVNNKNKIQKQQQKNNNKKDKQEEEEEKQEIKKEEKDSLFEELGDIIKVPEQQPKKEEQVKKEVPKNRIGNNDITELTELLKAINQNEEEQSKKEEKQKEPLKEEELLQPIKEKEKEKEKKQEQVIIQEELGDIVKLPDQQQEQEQQNPNKKEEIEQKQEQQQQQQQPNEKEEEKKLVKQEKQQQPKEKEEELENIVKQQQVKKEQQEQQQQPNKQKEEMKQQLKENNKNNQEQPKENKENKKVNDEKTTNNKKQPKRKLLTISEDDDNTIINRNIKIIDKKEIQHSTRHIYLQKQQHLQKLKQMKLSLQEELSNTDNTIIDNTIDNNNNSKNRKLLDKFSDSLIHVNKILNKEYGKIQRKVPAHMPHMINKEIMEELQNKWKNYFTITSSNRFRSSNDMQYSFTYFYYLMHEGIEYNSLNYFNENIDTNLDNELSDYEIRNICNLMLNKLSINIDKVKELYNNITITYNNLLPNKDIVNSSIKKKKKNKKNKKKNKKKNEYSSWFSKYYKNRNYNYDEYGNFKKYYKYIHNILYRQLNITNILLNDYNNNNNKINKPNYNTFIESGISNLIKLKVHKSENKYKYTLEDDKQIGFHMIRDDLDKVGEQLDELRRNKPKFICLNDDMNHTKPNEKVVEMLHNFYNWYFPNPSQFELNDGKINPYLYIDELNEHYRRLNYLNYLIDTIIFICCCCICCTLFICIRFLKRRNLNEKRKELTV